MDAKNVGYTAWLYFVNREGKCTHLLAKTSRGHLLIIEVTPFDHNGGIKTSTLSSSIIPHEFMLTCMKTQSDIKMQICFLSHNGLDLYHILGYSLLYKENKVEIPKFQMGEKFVIPIVYVKQTDLQLRVDKGENFRYYIERNSRVSVFYDLLKRSNCEHLLDSSGPYVLFVPDNDMLESAYGPKGRNLKSKSRVLDAMVCSYFVVGHHDRDESGDVISLIGQPLKIKNGLLQIPNHEVTEVEPVVFTSNGIMSVITCDDVLPPFGTTTFTPPKPILSHVTISDVHNATTKLYDATMTYSREVRQGMRDYIKIMTDKLDELDSLDYDVDTIKKEGNEVGSLYFGHVKSASRVIALQNNAETLAKNVKHI